MTNDTTAEALTLPMLGLMALDELRIAATHRSANHPGDPAVPVFLGLVRTEAFWTLSSRHPAIRRASSYFRLGDMAYLFDRAINYPLLDRFETHLSGSIWMVAQDLRIVDGSSFVELPCEQLPGSAYTVRDNDVALTINIDHERGIFRVTAAVVN